MASRCSYSARVSSRPFGPVGKRSSSSGALASWARANAQADLSPSTINIFLGHPWEIDYWNKGTCCTCCEPSASNWVVSLRRKIDTWASKTSVVGTGTAGEPIGEAEVFGAGTFQSDSTKFWFSLVSPQKINITHQPPHIRSWWPHCDLASAGHSESSGQVAAKHLQQRPGNNTTGGLDWVQHWGQLWHIFILHL